ncbi:hypothetical protein P3T36_007592 [Kitasatospora sp. MAP12-15]|uniref:hypothetical protein n=1 Tax=unclassified Kitasatospora TaxID=2633591 RepID=UPI0024733F49|nr:hypothetical protein [Kitasatospora sp. MAP12-44]MDH6108096.1 hypothetical protein [Kitasatospora sp. MAP12-44]
MVDVLRDAKPETKRQTYAALGLRCQYNHAQRKMQVRIAPDLHSLANDVGQWVVSEDRLEPYLHAAAARGTGFGMALTRSRWRRPHVPQP